MKRLYGPILLLVYGAIACLLLLILYLDNELAIILSPILPLIILFRNTKRLEFIYDFRMIYILSILVWSGGKSLSVLMSYGHSGIQGESLLIFMLAMIFVPLLALLFKMPSSVSILIDKKLRLNPKIIVFVLLAWLLLILMMLIVQMELVSEANSFILKQFSQGFALIFAAILVRLIDIRFFLAKFMIFIVTFVTTITFSLGAPNRLMLLLPIALLTLVLLPKNILAMRIASLKFTILFISITPFFLLILLAADLQKQANLPFLTAIESAFNNPEILQNTVSKSNYLTSKGISKDYFDSINSILEDDIELHGMLMYQLVSSVTPRLFFPDKQETDLSKIAWERGSVPQLLYYEIFLEPIIDSGIFGVIFYFLFFLLLMRISWGGVVMHQDGFQAIYSRSVYILNLLILFMIIRGPVVIFVWYALLPNFIIWWWLLRKRVSLKYRRPVIS